MPYQYSPAAWTSTLAALNAQFGTSVVLSQAAANIIIARADQDAEGLRLALANYNNLISLRHYLYALNAADPGVAFLTNTLNGIQSRWPDDIPAVPAVS